MPAYPYNVEQHHRVAYASSVGLVTQQLRNPLMGAVTEMPATGEAQSVSELLGELEYSYGEDRSRRNVENPVQGSRRWVVRPPIIESGQYIDREDKFAMATDPTSVFVRAHSVAVTRGWADRLLGIRKVGTHFDVADGGILGQAREGKTPGTGADLPAAQYIPHDSAGLTLDKLRAAVLKLELADFGLEDDDELYALCTPKQKDDLLAVAQASATNLNAFQIEQLRTGKPTTLMGINWIFTNRLPRKAGASGPRLVPVFSKKNIIAGVWQGIVGDMWNDSHARNLPYVHVGAYLDCVRAEDKGVVVIECNE